MSFLSFRPKGAKLRRSHKLRYCTFLQGFLITQYSPQLRLSTSLSSHARVSVLTAIATTRLFSDRTYLRWYIRENQDRIRRAWHTCATFLDRNRIPCIRPRAGTFVWVKIGTRPGFSWKDEKELAEEFGDCNVMVGNGLSYHAVEPGWFRITFTVEPETLRVGLQRMERALARFFSARVESVLPLHPLVYKTFGRQKPLPRQPSISETFASKEASLAYSLVVEGGK